MLKVAQEAILDSGDFLSLDQTAQQLGLLPTDVDKWKAEGLIFSIQHAGCSLFPTVCLPEQRCTQAST